MAPHEWIVDRWRRYASRRAFVSVHLGRMILQDR